MTTVMSLSLRSSHLTAKPRTSSMFSQMHPTPGETGKQIGRTAEFLGMEAYCSDWN